MEHGAQRFPNAYAGIKHLFSSTIMEVAAFMIVTFGSILMLLAEALENTTLELSLMPVGIYGIAGYDSGEIILFLGLGIQIAAAVLHVVGLKHAAHDEEMFRWGLILVLTSLTMLVLAETAGQASELMREIFESLEDIADLAAIGCVCKGIERVTSAVGRDDVAKAKLSRVCMGFVLVALIEEGIGLVLPRTMLWRTMIALVLRVVGYILYMVYIFAGYSALAPKE